MNLNTMQFHPVTVEDARWMRPMLMKENCPASAGFFGTNLLWGSVYGQKVCPYEERVLACYEWRGRPSFAWPMGEGSLQSAMEAIFELSHSQGYKAELVGLTQSQLQQLQTLYPDRFQVVEARDMADYIYTTQKLASLSGKKLQAKRNHCNRFEKENPDWHFEPLTAERVEECLQLLDLWTQNKEDADDKELAGERRAIELAFSCMEQLGFFGGCLYVGERLVAFTLGEEGSGDTADIHFEKADAQVDGAFAMINREFARMIQKTKPHILYLNREEDMGHENLRKAKESYHPDILLTKYRVKEL